ncbi:hypothetical protein ACFSX9_13100 [Flavobacterium ardleyense]|uniref:Uncharacterized protein n=1 Tax=Flavobacterium ardleyense TaxID=2038737 RepID=A0ABW5ZBU1_9FLAO
MYKLFFLGVIGLPTLILLIVLVLVIKYLFFNNNNSKTENNLNEVYNTSKNVIGNNLTKVKKIAEQNISKSYISNYNWLLVNETDENIIYTFRNNDELLITINGIVEKYSYELIVDNNSILITKSNIIQHYNIVNKQNEFLILQLLSTDNLLIFANQTKYKDYIKSELKEIAKGIANN